MTILFDIHLSFFPSAFCPCLHVICFTTETSHSSTAGTHPGLGVCRGHVKTPDHFRCTRARHVSSVTGYNLLAVITCHVSPGHHWSPRVVTCVVPPGQWGPLAAVTPEISRVATASLSPASWPGGGQCRAHQPIRGRDWGLVTNQRPSWADRSRDHQWHTAMASEQPQLPQRRILWATSTSSFLFRTAH